MLKRILNGCRPTVFNAQLIDNSNGIKMTIKTIVTSLSLAIILLGCATSPPKPILYPNAHFKQVGQQVANHDIASCKALAHSYGVNEKRDGEIGKNAAGGAAIGGATAGAWGLFYGDALDRAGAGAVAGAAAGATRGAIRSSETSSVFKNFVKKCLRDHGYEVIGWQ